LNGDWAGRAGTHASSHNLLVFLDAFKAASRVQDVAVERSLD